VWVPESDDAESPEQQEVVPLDRVKRIVETVYGQRQDKEHNPHGEHAHDVWQVGVDAGMLLVGGQHVPPVVRTRMRWTELVAHSPVQVWRVVGLNCCNSVVTAGNITCVLVCLCSRPAMHLTPLASQLTGIKRRRRSNMCCTPFAVVACRWWSHYHLECTGVQRAVVTADSVVVL
jgi:hypothetical protein